MQLLGVLVVLVSLSTACGLRCYKCSSTDAENCTEIETCPANIDRCGTFLMFGEIIKGCQDGSACQGSVQCCKGDLCNRAVASGSSLLLLLLLSSAVITLFL